MFDVSTSLVFKEQKVVRFTTRSAMPLSIWTYSTKLVDGSYKSAVKCRSHHALGLKQHHLSRDDGHYLL